MSMSAGPSFRVSGRVQGVGYRAAARTRARELGLDGWVRNLPDGRVEACAAGAPAALDQFAAWLAQGPTLAEVSAVECAVVDEDAGLTGGFSIC